MKKFFKNHKIIFTLILLIPLILFPTTAHATSWWDVGGHVQDAINNWFKSLFTSVMDFAVAGCKAIFDQIDQSNSKDIQAWYAIFLGFATTLVVVVALSRIVLTMIKEADESTDATWANIFMDSVKSAISIPIMVFLQWVVLSLIVVPLGKYMFDMDTKYSASTIMGTKSIGDTMQMGFMVTLVVLAFFLIVTIVFMVKICIFLAEMVWFNLAIPFVAVSIASETFDYGMTWWKKLLYVNISLLSQVLSMTLCVWGVTHWVTNGFYAFALSIGMGFMVIHPPKVIEDFWSSVGLTKTGARGLRSLGSMMMSRRGGGGA